MDYIKGIIFLICFIPFLYGIGLVITKKESTFSYKLLLGYVVYTFFQAIGGIITQFFKLDWLIYKSYMILLVGILLCFIVRHLYKNKNFQNQKILGRFVQHINTYKALYILAFVMVVLALMNVVYLWLGNQQDDGWYLMKVANLPYLGNQYDINYATGFQDTLGLYRTLNTFELDYAFWSDLFTIYPSVFCKAIMAFFNYFLILNAIYEFVIQLIKSDEKIKTTVNISILLIPILFFCINQETLANHGILNQQDGWHFNTAVWYGSSIVRCLSPFILISPILIKKKIDLKDIILICMTCVALISKASQAAPTIFLILFSFLIVFVLERLKGKKVWVFLFILVVILCLIPGFIPGIEELSSYMKNQFIPFIKSPVIIFDVIIIAYSLRLKNSVVNRWDSILLCMIILMFMPAVNTMFLNLSFYTFVQGRIITMMIFIMTITAFCYIGIICYCYEIKPILLKVFCCFIGISSLGVYFISQKNNIGISSSVNLIMNNPKLIPESTYVLSCELENIAKEDEKKISVLTSAWVTASKEAHALGTNLRISAPNVYSISAVHRYISMSEDSLFSDFNDEKQMMFEDYVSYSYKGQKLMQYLLESYPIDYIVFDNEMATENLMNEFSFELVDELSFPNENKTYYILKNPYKIIVDKKNAQKPK